MTINLYFVILSFACNQARAKNLELIQQKTLQEELKMEMSEGQRLLQEKKAKRDQKQVVWSQKDIKLGTKAYIGLSLETKIGGQTRDQLAQKLEENFYVSFWAKEMMANQDFTFSLTSKKIKLVRLKVKDLGFPISATTDEIFQKAQEFGLELCPGETGPYLRIQYLNQPPGEELFIAMKPIADAEGYPRVFILTRCNLADPYASDLWLTADFRAKPTNTWNSEAEFVFRLRRSPRNAV